MRPRRIAALRTRPGQPLIALLLVMLCMSGAQRASAQPGADGTELAAEDVEQGGALFSVSAGFGAIDTADRKQYGFALPIANSQLARAGAQDGSFQWQLAYSYSVMPVRVDILQRQAIAFRGRIEVESLNAYSAGEADTPAPMTFTQDVLIPPGVQRSYFLLPRVAVASRPGGLVSVRLRLYRDGATKPMTPPITVSAQQLEPAHTYCLLLDETADEISGEEINPGNKLGLELRFGREGPDAERVPAGLWSFGNYYIPTDPKLVAALPLSARDFAFALISWPRWLRLTAQEQLGLQQFVLAGGYLCLYDAPPGALFGRLHLDRPAQQAGRGMLLANAGGLDAARIQIRNWLEGELTELALLCAGRSGPEGSRLAGLTRDATLTQQLDVSSLLGLGPRRRESAQETDWTAPDYPSHDPGFLHPIWIYRDTLRRSATEPWDYPQFARPRSSPADSALLRNIVRSGAVPGGVRVPALDSLLYESRRVPLPHLAAVCAALLGLLALALPRAGWSPALIVRNSIAVAVLVVLGAAVSLWLRQQTVPPDAIDYTLTDADSRLEGRVVRRLAVVPGNANGRSLEAGSRALLRRVISQAAPEITLSTQQGFDRPGQSSVSILGTVDSFVYSESAEGHDAPAGAGAGSARDALIPVSVAQEGHETALRLDTSSLPAGSLCYLETSGSWLQIPPGRTDYVVRISVPPLPVQPGRERLEAWIDMLKQRGITPSTLIVRYDLLNATRAPLFLLPDSTAQLSAQQRLGWLGIVQQPWPALDSYSLLTPTPLAVLHYELPQPQASREEPRTGKERPAVRSSSFVRQTIELAGAQQSE